jgi:hypothetical protein
VLTALPTNSEQARGTSTPLDVASLHAAPGKPSAWSVGCAALNSSESWSEARDDHGLAVSLGIQGVDDDLVQGHRVPLRGRSGERLAAQ